MIKGLLFTSVLVTSFVPHMASANSGADLLLNKNGSNNNTGKIIKQRKAVVLDNAFLVQVYGSLRALGIKNSQSHAFYDELLNKNYLEAYKQIEQVSTNSIGERNLLNASKLYLEWNLNLTQSFFNNWLTETNRYDFLNSELGVALDQIIASNASNWLLQNAVFISKSQYPLIDNISDKESKFNFSVQAYRNLRTGKKSVAWMGNLAVNDPLRFELAQSAILDYAKSSELAQAGKLVKEVLEPTLNTTNDIEKISAYYMLLGRLLYQAKAYPAAKQYYMAVPDESKQFLQARTESLWISMRTNDHSAILGELKSLELQIFENKFLPEVYLVNAMAHLQQCQFSEVQRAFNQFVRINKIFAEKIETNIKAQTPAEIDTANQYVSRMKLGSQKISSEMTKLNANKKSTTQLVQQQAELTAALNNELRREWKNRKVILEQTLRRMRFVKVEFLSTMRRLKSKLALMQKSDNVSTMSSAIDKTDKLEFRYDDVMFADELFNLTSEVKNLCLQGRRNEK